MNISKLVQTSSGVVLAACSLWAFQRPFREYPAIEYNDFPLPADYQQPAEFAFARLMYPPAPTARFDRAGRFWAQGMSSWTQDYPRADRHLAQALRRLTRIDTRSVEQSVNLDDADEVYNWPFIYAVRTGEWDLTDAQARKLRDYIDRGGFLMVDDFWGTFEWQVFMRSMSRIFPDRQPVDVDNADSLFHTIYDLNDRFRVTGAWGRYGRPYQDDGDTPYWRAIYGPKNRVAVAIVANSDLGDSLGVGRRSLLPGEMVGLGHPRRGELHLLRDHPLTDLAG
ncbi:MAG TPA: DUF4159 domain-containing protein [Bryobacteraceae bacterium]